MSRSRSVDALTELPDAIHFVKIDNFTATRSGECDEFVLGGIQARGGFSLEERGKICTHEQDPPFLPR